MRKMYWMFGVIVVLCTFCTSPKNEHKDNSNLDLDKLYLAYFNEYLSFHPEKATKFGYSQYNDQWADNLSEKYLAAKKAFFQRYLDTLALVDLPSLSASEIEEMDIFHYVLSTGLEGLNLGIQPGTIYIHHPLHQYHRGTQHEFIKLAKGTGSQPFNTAEDYDDFLKRLNGFSLWLTSARERMEEAIDQNQTLPKKIVMKMLPQFDNWITTQANRNPFYFSLKIIPSEIPTEDSLRITTEYIEFIESKLIPQFEELKSFIEHDYLPHSNENDGLASLPDGTNLYAFLVKYWTTTDLSPEEVYQLGMNEVGRISKEMDSIRDVVGFEGDLKAFFNHLNTDKQFFPFESVEAVINRHEQTASIVRSNIDQYFGIKPNAGFEIRAIDPTLASASGPHYDPPSLDGTRAGIFYDAIPDPKKYNSVEMESLFLHEAIPGHHFQVTLNQELEGIPAYRKVGAFGAFHEGWGLYSENLGKELGIYTDPYQYFGKLNNEMLRAIRLVVDVGLHAKGWSREQAVAYMRDHMPISEARAIIAIERYMVRPGQALSYKIGELKLKELRDRCRKSLGSQFVIRDFHDLVLKSGNMPLSILERKVSNWIKDHQN